MSTQEGSNVIMQRLQTVALRLEDHLEDVARSNVSGRQTTSAIASAVGSQQPVVNKPVTVDVASFDTDLKPFDETVMKALKEFADATKALSGAPESLVDQVEAFQTELNLFRGCLSTAPGSKKSNPETFEESWKSLTEVFNGISNRKTKPAERRWDNYLAAVKEASSCVGWIRGVEKPSAYVQDVKQQTEYWTIKIVRDLKPTSEQKTSEQEASRKRTWVNNLIQIIDNMIQYVSVDTPFQSVLSTAAPSPSVPSTVAPPSYAPPPSIGVAALFGDLNRGSEVTKGLKKVDKSEMTHKNPALRSSGVVPAATTVTIHEKFREPADSKKPKGELPKFALEDNRWIIEYQENKPNLELVGSMKQTVNIYGCKNTTVLVKNKVNAVTMIDCKQTSVSVRSVVSSIEITKSTGFKVEVIETAPTVQLDSADSGQIFLSRESLGVEIFTTKCSSINVNIPVEEGEDGDFEEQPVPEMLKTVVKDGKLISTIVDHAG